MIINFSSVRLDTQLSVTRAGDTLIVNGEVFDFSPLLEGATLPTGAVLSPHFSQTVDRVDGELELTLILPHGPNAPESTRFPAPLVVTVDGPVAIPEYDAPEEVSNE